MRQALEDMNVRWYTKATSQRRSCEASTVEDTLDLPAHV